MLRLCALAIGGVDPGGGAGLLADLRAFEATGLFGCGVVAVMTVQSTDGLLSATPLAPSLVVRQAEEVVRAQRVRVVKLGALGSPANVRAVARWLGRHPELPVVLDPVMAPTRGPGRLLATEALAAMRGRLVPRATLVTANAVEAAALTGRPVETLAEARRAARTIVAMGARAALVKGGHLRTRDVVDVLVIGERIVELRAPRLRLPPLHGGGCVLASLLAGLIARRRAFEAETHLVDVVREARRLHRRALRRAIDVGGAMRVLVP